MKESSVIDTRWKNFKTDMGLIISIIGLLPIFLSAGKGSAWIVLLLFSIFGLLYFSPPIWRRVKENCFGRMVSKMNFYFLEPKSCLAGNGKKYLTDGVKKQFREISRDALECLFIDQLPSTGGWAKTYFWRQKVDAKGRPSSGSIPAAGTFTGTLAAYEALLSGPFTIKDIPHVEELITAMKSLLQPDGSYHRNRRTTSVGETWQLQSPRHTAAAFILRTLTGAYTHSEDKRTVLCVLSKMNCEDDYFTKAVISKSFLKYLTLKNDIPMRNTLYNIWNHFYEGATQEKDIRFLWYSASSHAGEMAAEQWYTIAFLLPMLEVFQKLERKKNSELIAIICDFIRKTYSEKNSESGLLPLGYKKNDNGIIIAVGSSICASALAVYIINALAVIDGSIGNGLDDIHIALLNTLVETDIAKFSLDFSSKKGLQGYLDFSAILICFNQLGFGVSTDMIPKAMNDRECAIINEHFNALEICVDEQGLYI